MKRAAIPFLCLLGPALGALAEEMGPPAPPPPPARVRWNNTESIPGDIVGGTADRLLWKSPFFLEPVSLTWHSLRRIDRNLTPIAVAENFKVSFRDGSHLLGDVTAITADSVHLRSVRHEDVEVKRSEVLSFRRLRGNRLVWAGPVGDVGWKIADADTTRNLGTKPPGGVMQMVTAAGGALEMPYWNRAVSLYQTVPEKVELAFQVRSSKRPEFKLSLGNGLRLETWDNEIVATLGGEYKSIRLLDDGDRSVALKICWDRKSSKGVATTPGGEPVAEWQFKVESPEVAADRVVLHNKGRDLTLDIFQMRRWEDQPAAKFDEKLPQVELAGGTVRSEKVLSLADGMLTLEAAATATDAAESLPVTMPLAEVDAITFSSDAPKPQETPALFTYADGTMIHGSVEGIADGKARLRTSFTNEPLSSSIEALRQVLLKVRRPEGEPEETPFPALDKMVLSGSSLHGKLVPSGNAQPRWLLPGALEPVTPTPGQTTEITQTQTPPATTLASGTAKEGPAVAPTINNDAPALFYTVSGDVMPGRLIGIDKHVVEFESPLTGTTRLPVESLDAVQFNVNQQADIKGFLDPGWQVIRGDKASVKREGEKLTLAVGTSIAHYGAMQSTEMSFKIQPSNYATFRMKLFSTGSDEKPGSGLVIAHFGSQIYTGLEAAEGQLNDRNQYQAPSGKAVTVKLVVQDKFVDLYLDGMKQQRLLLDYRKRPGMGLVIEPCSVWENAIQPVSLSDFTTKSAPGMAVIPHIAAEARAQTLLVPRFRKEDPPRHALIAANGDVLRGEIEAVTSTHFGFRSGLENLKVPRNRVKAVIWLKKPLADGDAKTAESTALADLPQLDRMTSRRITYSRAQLSALIDALKPDAGDIKFQLPEKQDTRTFRYQFGVQTVRDALDGICNLFGLRYRIVGKNTIVIEPPPAMTPGLLYHAYWLKPDALEGTVHGKVKEPAPGAEAAPVSLSIQKKLEDLGMTFPAGTSVSWNPGAGLLALNHTAAAHEKLKELAQAQWGGVLGSPTHWLQLGNGGRLGLAVERFDADVIAGKHPVYGECKVPRTQVFMLASMPPEASFSMKSLAGWQLVNAPDPEIPDPSGTSSPLVG
ncbi:MAG: hypothetical protein ACAI34_24840, partial [Verrucomicrobium sp.]